MNEQTNTNSHIAWELHQKRQIKDYENLSLPYSIICQIETNRGSILEVETDKVNETVEEMRITWAPFTDHTVTACVSFQGVEDGERKLLKFIKDNETDSNITGCFTDSLEG